MYYFTKHVKQKIVLSKKTPFPINKLQIKYCIEHPKKVEVRSDGTIVSTVPLNRIYILKVVSRKDNDIMVIITFYPARKERYEI